jgi:hypothetical protein
LELHWGAPQRVIIAVLGFNPWGDEPMGRLIPTKHWYEVQLLIDKPQAVEDPRFDHVAKGHGPRLRGPLGRAVKDTANAECVEHPRHETQMLQDLTTGWLSHSVLLRRGDSPDMPKLLTNL